jgi:hypothetical protein
MRTYRTRGGRAVGLAVLALVVSLSERAQAQQSGLFPLAPIRRERPPCANEDPVYKLYKQQYFGYHPTYWSRFPGGWGITSKEAPDKEKSFTEQPLGKPPELGEGAAGPAEEGMGPMPGAGAAQPAAPPLPRGRRSPFDMDNGGPGPIPGPAGNPAPRPATPRDASPFNELPQGAAYPSRRGTRTRTPAPSVVDDAPELSPPAAQPAQNSAARSSAGDADEDVVAHGNDGPWLPIDDIDVSRSANLGTLLDSDPIQPATPTTAANSTNTTQPAPRRGFISSLFGGLGTNWFRR